MATISMVCCFDVPMAVSSKAQGSMEVFLLRLVFEAEGAGIRLIV